MSEPQNNQKSPDVSSAISSKGFPQMSTATVTPDHWTRRTAIMALMTGVAFTVSGYDIAKMDETLGRQITVTGYGLAIVGAAAWFITHLILKGSRNEAN